MPIKLNWILKKQFIDGKVCEDFKSDFLPKGEFNKIKTTLYNFQLNFKILKELTIKTMWIVINAKLKQLI